MEEEGDATARAQTERYVSLKYLFHFNPRLGLQVLCTTLEHYARTIRDRNGLCPLQADRLGETDQPRSL